MSNTNVDKPAQSDKPAPVAPEDKDLKNFTIPLTMRKASRWEDKHTPELIVNAKYVPYAALRQQLWRCLLGEYDADDSGRLTRVEFVTMLDSLGSTLSEETIDTFFKRFQSAPPDEQNLKEAQEITIDQAVVCLEDQLSRQSKGPAQKDVAPTGASTEGEITLQEKDSPPANPSDLQLSAPESDAGGNGTGLTDHNEKSEEHVIMITECPLCHQPRLNKRSEVDIVTHIATCASQDWRQVDHFVMGGFVTPDQAHRGWYTKVRG
jgi:phosphatidylserine decarboxylase